MKNSLSGPAPARSARPDPDLAPIAYETNHWVLESSSTRIQNSQVYDPSVPVSWVSKFCTAMPSMDS
eukprot:2318348-Rhodomonas_salina.1